MPSQADELAARVQRFVTRVLKFIRTLSRDLATNTIARQLARAATGISGNHRSARRARSRAEFVAKLGVVADEADEAEHWLAVLKSAQLASGPELEWLMDESSQLRAIFVRAATTARANYRRH